MRSLLAALALAGIATFSAHAQSAPVTEEILVTGVREGPRLWHFDGPKGEVYILGTVRPLPKGLAWKSTQLELVLKRTDRVLVGEAQVSLGLRDLVTNRDAVRNPDDAKLSDQLDARTRERLVAQRQALNLKPDAFENWRPFIAGGMLLNRAFDRAGLGGDVDAQNSTLAQLRKRKIKPTNVFVAPRRNLVKALNGMPLGADAPCLGAYLNVAEKGVPMARKRAIAWAEGDIATLRQTQDNTAGLECAAALEHGGVPIDQLVETYKKSWMTGLVAAGEKPGVTLAIVPMSYLLQTDGLLDRLAKVGVTVEGP
jgi:uncharacterized protein YbaP (TraB family)